MKKTFKRVKSFKYTSENLTIFSKLKLLIPQVILLKILENFLLV
jgi:hypothetical protein